MSAPVRLAPGLVGLVLPGGFRLEEAVAEGASGIVVRAVQESLSRKVAVKISHEADEAAVARARREARIVAALDAPGIVRVYASGELADGRAWVAMEWIDGVSLEEALAGGPLRVPRALAIAAQIARALAHAHAAGVIHRDLKPANVMLRPGDRVVVVDFGIARAAAVGPGGSASRMAGTPHYMAPEQAAGDDIDERVDLYALGGVLYRMLAGAVPYAGSAIEVMLGHLHGEPPALPATVPPAVGAMVHALMAKRPDERPGPAAALAEELDRMASAAWQRSGEVDPSAATFAAMTITPAPAPVAKPRTWRSWVVGGGVAAAVLAVAAVVAVGMGTGAGSGSVTGAGSETGSASGSGSETGSASGSGSVTGSASGSGTGSGSASGSGSVTGSASGSGSGSGSGTGADEGPDVALVVDGGWAMRASRPRHPVAGTKLTLTLEIWDGDGEPAKAGTLAFTVRAPDGTTRPPQVAGTHGVFELTLSPRLPGPHVVTVFAPSGETTLAVELDVEAKGTP